MPAWLQRHSKKAWAVALTLFTSPFWRYVERAGDVDFLVSLWGRLHMSFGAILNWGWVLMIPLGFLVLWLDSHRLKPADSSDGGGRHRIEELEAELSAANERASESEYRLEIAQAQLAIGPEMEPNPKNTPPPNDLVILFRRYARPAYEAARAVMENLTRQGFDRGGHPGLAAGLFNRYQLSQANRAVGQVEDAINGTADFEEAFKAFYAEYDEMVCRIRHFLNDGTTLDFALFEKLVEADRALEKELLDRAAGLNGEWLGVVHSMFRDGRTFLREWRP